MDPFASKSSANEDSKASSTLRASAVALFSYTPMHLTPTRSQASAPAPETRGVFSDDEDPTDVEDDSQPPPSPEPVMPKSKSPKRARQDPSPGRKASEEATAKRSAAASTTSPKAAAKKFSRKNIVRISDDEDDFHNDGVHQQPDPPTRQGLVSRPHRAVSRPSYIEVDSSSDRESPPKAASDDDRPPMRRPQANKPKRKRENQDKPAYNEPLANVIPPKTSPSVKSPTAAAGSSSSSPSINISSQSALPPNAATKKAKKMKNTKPAKTQPRTASKTERSASLPILRNKEIKDIVRQLEREMKDSPNRTLQHVNDLIAEEKSKGLRPPLCLNDLHLPNIKKEVAMMDDDDARARIERLVIHTTHSILEGYGFSYDVPSRASNNQLYVPELDRIVLKDRTSERPFASLRNGRKAAITTRIIQLVYELCAKKIHVTKRDLFYTDVKLFSKQKESDDVLDDVACMIGSTRSSLNVVASEKGIVVGRVRFKDAGDPIDCTRMGVGGKAIPPYIDRITEIEGDAKFILLVEKDAAFMRLAEDRFYNDFPCIIITAKGQPDVATRLFLKKLKSVLGIPVLGLVDSDPYGLKILSVYMSGSKNMSYDSASLTTADIKWLGVRPSDLDKYNIPEQCRLEMSDKDIATGKQMLEEEFIKKNPQWYRELELMVQRKEKAEIQALSNFGFQYLTKVYLPLKLREGDWI